MSEFMWRQSEMKAYIEDPRRWFLDYYCNPNPRGQAPTSEYPGTSEIGSMIHVGIEAGYADSFPMLEIDDWVIDNVTLHEGNEAAWKEAASKALTWALWYLDWESTEGIMVGTKILGAEHDLEIEIPGTLSSVYGTIDLLYYDQGELVVRDYKSGTQFRELNANDFQLWTYSWMASQLTGDIPGRAEYARIRQAMKSSKPMQDIVPTAITAEAMDRHGRDLIALAEEMEDVVEWLQSGGDPSELRYNTTNDCGWKCNNQAACVAMSYGEDWESTLIYPDGSPVGINQRGSTS